MKNNSPQILLKTTRNNETDCDYFGSIYYYSNEKLIKYCGYSPKNICFLRSLAKPMQASIMCDYNIIQDLKITKKELAIFCGSHSGSPKHIKLLKEILNKYNIKEKELLLKAQIPLDLKGFNGKCTKLHNNCSAKHIMMVLMCKYLNINPENYTNENHKIQKIIRAKQEELSKYTSNLLTYDGCSTPLWGLPIENLAKAYFNLFNQDKYNILINSILKNPYIFGGNDRLDTEIIKLSKGKLFSKVGANGFVLVYNIKKNEILIVKLTQNNNAIRRIIALKALNMLNWLNIDIPKYEYNQMDKIVAKYCYNFKF